MRAEVGLGVLLSPPVENLGEHGSLAAPAARFFFSTNTR
jgi:hypothetical protein